MAALVTERDARTLTISVNNQGTTDYRAGRVFDVSGVADAPAALAALATYGINIGVEHPQASAATVNDISQSENVVAGMWTYNVSYSSTGSAGSTTGLLLEPPVIGIKPYRFEILSDKDAEGYPVVNSANRPFGGGVAVIRRGILWTFERWETTYPWITDFTYGGKVNANSLTLTGIPATIAPKLAQFVGVEQLERSSSAPVVRCRYTIDIREDGHDTDLIDQGSQGWAALASVPRLGFFRAVDNASVDADDIRLNGFGVPLNAAFKVALEGRGPLKTAITPDPPSPTAGNSPAGRLNPSKSTVDVKILSFAKCKPVLMNLAL